MKRRTPILLVVAWAAGLVLAFGAGCGGPQKNSAVYYAEMAPAKRILTLEADGPTAKGAQEAIKDLLGSTEPLYRAQAAQTLALWAAAGDAGLAVPAITSADLLVRNVAQATYIEHNPRSYGLLLVQNNTIVEVQPKVLAALYELGDPQGVSSLEQVLTPIQDRLRRSLSGDADEAVLAADLLANISDVGARRMLIRLVESGEGQVLAKATQACVTNNMGLGPTLLPLAFGDGVIGRRAVMTALVLHPDPRLAKLMVAGLNDADPAVRHNAIRALGNLNGAAPVEELTAKLLGPGEDKLDIIRALGAIGARGAETLRQYLRRGAPLVQLEVTALLAMAPYAGRDDIPWVTARLKSNNKYVRAASLVVLGRIGNPEAQAAVVEAVKDPETLVRASAARALGQLGTVYACKELLFLLEDPSPVVVSMAAWGLGKGDYSEAVPALEKIARTRQPASRSISDLYSGPELAALESLGKIGGPRAVAVLVESLGAPGWQTRATAAQALGVAGDHSDAVIQALEKRIQDPVNLVRAQALLALKALGKTYGADQLKAM
ncbi:MAG: HEAT repeat domain-containing protein [Planctomycetota bacterium]|nr:HEAT repeat domain-containing protein [Planctomycetota bacterium]